MPIRKCVFEVTVLYDSDTADVPSWPLDQIGAEMDCGEVMGTVKLLSDSPVPVESVSDEEQNLGGDGTFFRTEN